MGAVLRGDPSDSRVAWIQWPGQRVEAWFPAGFRARFTPKLEILDASGRVRARDGDPLDGGCPRAEGGILIFWP
jgi:hypothetical protein